MSIDVSAERTSDFAYLCFTPIKVTQLIGKADIKQESKANDFITPPRRKNHSPLS